MHHGLSIRRTIWRCLNRSAPRTREVRFQATECQLNRRSSNLKGTAAMPTHKAGKRKKIWHGSPRWFAKFLLRLLSNEVKMSVWFFHERKKEKKGGKKTRKLWINPRFRWWWSFSERTVSPNVLGVLLVPWMPEWISPFATKGMSYLWKKSASPEMLLLSAQFHTGRRTKVTNWNLDSLFSLQNARILSREDGKQASFLSDWLPDCQHSQDIFSV